MKKLFFLLSLSFCFSLFLGAQGIDGEINELPAQEDKQMDDRQKAESELPQQDSTSQQLAPEVVEKDSNYIFVVVEEMPEFPGGVDSMNVFILKHLNAASFNKSNYNGQKVIIEVVVEQTGALTDAAVLRSSGFKAFDNEALRVVQKMPVWKPGYMGGMPVRTKKLIPISVTLNKK